MPDITISIPEEWAELVSEGDIREAQYDLLKWAIHESAGRLRFISDSTLGDAVGESIPRLVREVERLQSLTEAIRQAAGEEEQRQNARLTAIEGGK